MEKIVFYSWQNQLPGRTNRNFIEKALIKAAGTVSGDDTMFYWATDAGGGVA